MKILSRGTTIIVASGDAGSPGRTNEICRFQFTKKGWTNINPVYPGSSPWITSLGATYLVKSDNKFYYDTPICKSTPDVTCANGIIEGETTFDKTGWTSGSGLSRYDEVPSWQKEYVKSYLESGIELPNSKYYNAKGRAYPDVSVLGHNCIVKGELGWEFIDGTSCSSPIFAGLVTNLNSFQKSRGKPLLGFINPLLYKMHKEEPSTFQDILIGNSTCTEYGCCGNQFGFIASKGYDLVTGLGSPNIEQIKRYLLTHT
jgi:tripeptidyl-peptidase-1